MTNLKQIRKRLDDAQSERRSVVRNINQRTQNLKELGRDARRHEQAIEIIKEVGLRTQQQLQYHIADITTLAMDAVFDDPFQLLVEFVQRRNKTECDLLFERDGVSIDPLSASGGGVVDVAAFALRVASYTMQSPRNRNVIILDEPMRFLSEDKQELASLMIKEISQKLNIQFIIITHEPALAAHADKQFTVKLRKRISVIETI